MGMVLCGVSINSYLVISLIIKLVMKLDCWALQIFYITMDIYEGIPNLN